MSAPILGQDSALDVLRAAVRQGRFHHAWIFAGPRGVGKFTTAVELAAILLDPQGDIESLGGAAPSTSQVQRLVQAGTHPDLHVIRKELALYSADAAVRSRKQMNIPIDVLREHMLGGEVGSSQQEAAAYRTSSLGHGKVFIIDEAELLAGIAQNALLKTLEEPPPSTYLILITAHPERLTATIMSRCQHVRFHRLDDEAMQQWAASALADVSDTQRQWTLRFAQGSPGMALRAVDYELHAWAKRLEPMLDQLSDGVFPPDMGAALGELVDGYASAWVSRNTNASKDAANKDGCAIMLAMLGQHVRDELDAAARHDDTDACHRLAVVIDVLRDAERQMWSNVNPKLVMENLVAQWASAMRGEIAVL